MRRTSVSDWAFVLKNLPDPPDEFHDTISGKSMDNQNPPNNSTSGMNSPDDETWPLMEASYLSKRPVQPPMARPATLNHQGGNDIMASGEPTFALKALELNHCPFYSKGDSLHVRMPGVFGGGSQFCTLPVATFIPTAMEGTQSEGTLTAGFKNCSCKWGFCKVEKLRHALVEIEDALTAEDQMQGTFMEQLPAPVIKALKERGTPRSYMAGAVLLETNVPASEFHVLIKGTARIATPREDGSSIELTVLKKGDCFGEMSILTGAATSNRVEAVEACMTLVLTRSGLQKLVVDFPVLSIILYRMLSKRIRTSNQHLVKLLAPTLLGDLSQLNFADLVQTIYTSRLSGVLHVEDKQAQVARFGFREGHLLFGESAGIHGAESLDDVIRWKTGRFRFSTGEAIPPPNLDGDTMGILLDVVRRLDESSILERLDPPDDPAV
jgi:CRP-like cAMP-binding protein